MYGAATGVYRTRREQAKARLDRALEQQTRLQQEYDRLAFTLRDAFGVRLGQQSLYPEAREGRRATFLQRTTPKELRLRMGEIRKEIDAYRD